MARRYWLVALWAIPSIGVAFTLKTLIMPGKVIEAHAEIEETCESCHEDDESETQNELCLACHTDVRTDVSAGVGFHGRHPDVKGAGCYTCHDEHEGRDADIVELECGRVRAHPYRLSAARRARRGAVRRLSRGGHRISRRAAHVQRLSCRRRRARRRARADVRGLSQQRRRGAARRSITARVFALDRQARGDAVRGCHENQSFAAAPKECARLPSRRRCSPRPQRRAVRQLPQRRRVERDELRPRRRQRLRAARQPRTLELRVVPRDERGRGAAVDVRGLSSHRRPASRRARRQVRRIATTRCSGTRRASITRASAISRSSARIREVECTSCHTAGLEADLGRECTSCHAD